MFYDADPWSIHWRIALDPDAPTERSCNVRFCRRCGALVLDESTGLHDAFHRSAATPVSGGLGKPPIELREFGTVQLYLSEGSDGCIVLQIDTLAEPDGSDGSRTLRINLNDEPIFGPPWQPPFARGVP